MTVFKKLEMFVVVVAIALIGIIYAFKQSPILAPTNNPVVTQANDQHAPQMVPTSTVEYQGQDGKTALDLLQGTHQVDVKHYSFGDMVTGIDGLTADAKHFWAMYVNDQFSQVGASALVTKTTDKIKWQIEEVKN